MTHNSANQHRISTKEVSKFAEESRAFHAFIQFSHNISVLIYLTICKCTDTFCEQFSSLPQPSKVQEQLI